jgi:putative ABC transport system ATP-binding protein
MEFGKMTQFDDTDVLPAVIETKSAARHYVMGDVTVKALRGVDFLVRKGELVSIMGPSGSGKSTLMNLVGCLDTPTSGSVFLDGVDVSQLGEQGLAKVRNEKIGFIFQQFNLLARINVLDNVATPLLYSGMPAKDRKAKAEAVLERVGLADRMRHLPRELSGGQKQRVAIARALVNDPSLLLADEPTGALDQETGHQILNLFTELHEAGNTLVLVTHDPDIGAFTPRCIRILDGRIAA